MWRFFTIIPIILVIVNLVLWVLHRQKQQGKLILWGLIGFPIWYLIVLVLFFSGVMDSSSNLPVFIVYVASILANLGYLLFSIGKISQGES